jgi:hypothetical protein
MVDDVGGRGIATGAAEPLVTTKALYYRAGVVNSAVSTQIPSASALDAVFSLDTYAQA